MLPSPQVKPLEIESIEEQLISQLHTNSKRQTF